MCGPRARAHPWKRQSALQTVISRQACLPAPRGETRGGRGREGAEGHARGLGEHSGSGHPQGGGFPPQPSTIPPAPPRPASTPQLPGLRQPMENGRQRRAPKQGGGEGPAKRVRPTLTGYSLWPR